MRLAIASLFRASNGRLHGPVGAIVQQRTIQLHLQSPTKPPKGAACNGCGVCCLAEPCPLGMLISLRTRGECRALLWDEGTGRYRCGAASAPEEFLPWLPRGLARRLALRWIASGTGCDADLELLSTPTG